MNGKPAILDLVNRSPKITEAYDASTPAFLQYLTAVKAWYQAHDQDYESVDAEARLLEPEADAVGFRLALKIAESHHILSRIEKPVTITLLNPVYKETARMQTRLEHPHGEDSIRVKMRVLMGIEQLNPNLTCRLFVIDDGCPDNSGAFADSILSTDFPEARQEGRARVYSLSEAITGSDPDLPPGVTEKNGDNRSVKGGAVLLGMRKALADKDLFNEHIIIDNDADLSTHPDQIGLLIEPILKGAAGAVAGSRREFDSVALIGSSRNSRGRLFIQIWQHLLPELAKKITDTNRAFKAFSAPSLGRIIDSIETYTFPYQIELLQACISLDVDLQKRGIAYVDSEAASTQQGEAITETYLHQIKKITDIARRYKTLDATDPLLNYLESIVEEDWQRIESNPPERLEDLLR